MNLQPKKSNKNAGYISPTLKSVKFAEKTQKTFVKTKLKFSRYTLRSAGKKDYANKTSSTS